MRRIAIAVLLAVMLVLAGCHGGGGGGSEPDRSVDIVNAEDLKTGVSPDERPTVEADVSGDDVDHVNISYTVYNRADDVVAESTDFMNKPGEYYTYELPAYPAGYNVEYEVRAHYDDGETQTDSSEYIVSYVESVSGPSDGEELSEQTSEITIELETTAAVQSVAVEYTRELPEEGETVTNRTVNTSVTDSTVTLPIHNEELGETITKADVEYTVEVTFGYGDVGNWKTYSGEQYEYKYRNDREDVLVVPVTYENNTTRVSDITNSRVDVNATRAMWYYDNESRGEFSPTFEWLTNSSSEEYFVLDGNPDQYIGEHANTRVINSYGQITEYKVVYKHDRSKIRCTAAGEVKEQKNGFKFDRYKAVVFVQTDINGTIKYVRNGPNGTNETYDRDAKTMRAVNLGEWSDLNCSNVEMTGSHVVLSNEDNYGTYDHELGHAIFDWADYYGNTKDEKGVVGFWGLMGSGNNRDDYPSQIMAYHKMQEGWIETEDVYPLDEGESREVYLPYLKNDSTAEPQRRAALYATGAQSSIFNTYVFEARDPPERDHMPQDGWGQTTRGPGLVAYGVESGESVNMIWNENLSGQWRRTHPYRPTINWWNYSKTVHDPDAGFQFSLEDSSKHSLSEGLVLNLSNPGYQNLEGVNVFYQVDCKKIATYCDMYKTGTNQTTPIVGLMAYTEDGRVGVTPNGTVVNEVPGAYVVPAGNTYKVYVPDNVTARFEVDATRVDENASVDLVTQTVSRDENGTRIASEIENDTVEAGATAQPELARLNLSKRSWDAGQVRTLEGNETTLAVRNRGIAALENVTVTTDSPWASVNWTERDAIEDADAASLGVEFEVPGGTPVGTYTFNVTVTGDGTKTTQTETMQVTVDVLPTVYWNATPTNATRVIADDPTTQVEIVVRNSEDSNVPMYDVESTVTGSVTKFDVDAPRFVESVEPGERVTLTTTVRVPEDGIEEGTYAGLVDVETMLRHQQYFDYPVTVPSEYVVAEPQGHTTDVTVEAYGPSVNSSAEFHPEKQVAMRKGAATERVTVDPVESAHDVPAEGITVRATIPDGWRFQSSRASSPDETDVKVWIVEETGGDTPGGQSGKRHRLDPADYSLTVEDGKVVLDVADLRNTSFGQYMTDDHVLEFEFKLNKRAKASEYGYTSKVVAATQSPIDVYRFEQPAAVIDVFDPREGTPAKDVGEDRSRVERGTVRADDDGIGSNATLSNPEVYAVELDGEQTWWTKLTLESNDTDEVRNVWVPMTPANGTLQMDVESVTDDGYAVVDAVVTRNAKGAVSSALKDGERVRFELPVGQNVTTVETLEPRFVDENGTLALQTDEGQTAIEVNASDDASTANSADGSVPAVAGGDIFELDLDDRSDDDGESQKD